MKPKFVPNQRCDTFRLATWHAIAKPISTHVGAVREILESVWGTEDLVVTLFPSVSVDGALIGFIAHGICRAISSFAVPRRPAELRRAGRPPWRRGVRASVKGAGVSAPKKRDFARS